MTERPKEEMHILFVSPSFPMTSESPSLGLACRALLTFYNHILCPAGKASQFLPLLVFLLRQGHREAQKASSKAAAMAPEGLTKVQQRAEPGSSNS